MIDLPALFRRLPAIFLAVLLAGVVPAYGNEDILPLKDLKVGMKGIGKTVIHGREIETFNIEVMGILANNKINENVLINGKSILVKVAGKVIEEAGGIAAGMSGSPVYINGKLVGGLSSGWVMTDHTVGMVTPIEEMLEIWDYPISVGAVPGPESPVKWVSDQEIRIAGRSVRTFWEVCDPAQVAEIGIPASEGVFVRVGTPLFVQGLCDKALGVLSSRFRNRQMQLAPLPTTVAPIRTASSSAPVASETIEPGSAIGVQLARGDINLTTLGTLTYRDGKRILAFAHPFLKKGAVSFIMTGAHIYHSFSSVQMPFKIGAPTEIIGTVTQDREKGISGELGRIPPMVPVQLEITDKDLKRTRSINYQVVRDPGVLVSVLDSTLVQAIEGVIDRTGEGTALLGIALECGNPSGQKFLFRRDNLYYSKSDIVNAIIDEIADLIDTVTGNEIEEAFPTKLTIKLELENRPRVANIEKVEIKNTSITPGGVLEVWVTLRPYREKPLVRKAKLAIPADIGRENLTLTVYGLSNKYDETDNADSSAKDVKIAKLPKPEEANFENFETALWNWANAPRNSDLLFQLTSEHDETKKIKMNGKEQEILSTSTVVYGRVESTITLSEE